MKKSDLVFYGTCALFGIFNGFHGIAHLIYDVLAISTAVSLCIIVKNKYERK